MSHEGTTPGASPIEITNDGAVQTITINRPDKKNALTLDMYSAMTEALLAGDDDPEVGVQVFQGQPGAFCAGNDIRDFMQFAMKGELGAPILSFLRALVSSKKPLVASVDGLAIGIGTTLLFHCDYVIATDRSLFKTPFIDLGLVPEAGSSLIAPRLMGHPRAFELLCIGASFNAQEARSANFVNRVATADNLAELTREAANDIAAKPREAMAKARALMKGKPEDILARIDEEAVHFAERLRSQEAQAAFAAFLKKG